MVIAPASTGSASSSRKAVTSTDQTNSGILCSVMPGARMLRMVVMKLIAPRIDDAPDKWSDRIAMSTAAPPLCPADMRSEEHTSELQSLMRISYAVFCLKQKNHGHTASTRSDVMNATENRQIKGKQGVCTRYHRLRQDIYTHATVAIT